MFRAWILAVIASACCVRAQTDCRTPDGLGGNCKNINLCEPLRGILNQSPSREQAEFLRKSVCGYQGTTPKVCCPVQQTLKDDTCFTPEGQTGNCIDLYQCQSILNRLNVNPVPQETLEYLRRSRCNGPSPRSICCASSSPTQTQTPGPDGKCEPNAALPAFNSGCCGVEGNGNRIIGGTATQIDQYPWMALIEYDKNNKIKLLCGGALISAKYVLTAGHCVVGIVLRSGTPVSVRLGEYDTSTTEDCVPAEGGGDDCAEPIISVPIEKTIPHPQYNPNDLKLRRNDIALIRLRTLAPFTDFIRPICLPTNDVTLSPPADFKLWAAGWGATNATTSSSTIKLHVELPYTTLQQCQTSYSIPRRNVQLWTKQLCAGGVKDRDSCKGDSGGPLMHVQDSIHSIIGVVSFGPTPCGMENVPGVYTKVIEYNDWIRGEVKP